MSSAVDNVVYLSGKVKPIVFTISEVSGSLATSLEKMNSTDWLINWIIWSPSAQVSPQGVPVVLMFRTAPSRVAILFPESTGVVRSPM